MNSRAPRRTARFAAPMAAVLATTGATFAGLGGGGITHTWTGNVGTNWNTPGNWNTAAVPGAGHSVIVNSGTNNALLGSDTPALRSLFIGGSRSVSNNGFVLDVTNTLASITVNGLDSTLFITPGGSPFGFEAGSLEIENNGRLQFAGGWGHVIGEVALVSGGRITGNGHLDITSAAPAAFNGLNGNGLFATGGTLHVRVFGGGSIVLPPAVNATADDSGISITGPLMLPANNINLGANSAFQSTNNWVLGGTLNANSGPGEHSVVGGLGDATIEGDVVVTAGSELRFDTNVNFEATSTSIINSNAVLELTELFTVDAGHQTTINMNGRLLLNAPISANGWDGAIVSSAGAIESNSPFGLRIDGSLTLGSFGGLRTVIEGSSPVIITGSASAPGLGAIVNGTLEFSPSSTLSTGINASILVHGEMIARSNATLFGSGVVSVQNGGELTIQQDANFGIDLVNAGDLRIGTFANQNTVDVNGTLDQTSTGRLLIDIGGTGDSQRDLLQVSDDVSLDGTLHIALANGFTPAIGDQFQVISANFITGTFAALTGTPGFNVQYSPDSVTLVYVGVGLPGDVNSDGVVNVADLLMVIANWGAAAPNPADANGDGTVNVADLLMVIANWG